MHCDDLDRIASEILSGQLAHDPEAAQHLDRCARCRLLYGDWSEALPQNDLPPSVKESIVGTLLADLKPVRPQPPAFRLAATILLIVAGVAAGMMTLMGTEGLRLMSPPQALSLAAVGLSAALLLSCGLVALMHPARQQPWLPVGGMAVLVVGFCVVVLFLFPWSEPHHFLTSGLRCFGAALMMTVPTVVLVSRVTRRGYILDGPLAGAATGALGVVGAVTALQVFCPDQHAGHLLAGHGGALLAAISAGFLLGRRWRT